MLALLPRLRRFAYGLTGSIDQGDDLVQATCERAIRNIDTWQDGTRLDSWMYRIARNQFLNELRAKKVRGQHLEVTEIDRHMHFDGARAVDAQMTLNTVRALAARLPEEQRSVLILVCVEGLSYKEVAALLDLQVGTVTSRLARARITLKTFLEGGDPPQDDSARSLPE